MKKVAARSRGRNLSTRFLLSVGCLAAPVLAGVVVLAVATASQTASSCAAVHADGGRPIIYVSPSGDDGWSGCMARPSFDHSDGPLATLAAARDRTRALGSNGTIVVGGGDYYLAAPVEFTASDAGLKIVAAAGETPIFHGGPAVPGWRRDGDGRLTASITLPEGATVHDLFVNGQKAIRARYPNIGPDGGPRDGWLFAAAPQPGTEWQGNAQFRFAEGDLPDTLDMQGLVANIVGGFQPGTQWGSDTLPVTAIDRDSRTIHTGGTGYFFTGEGSRYFLTGGRDLFDAPGEWWYDAAAQEVHYIPQEPGGFDAVAGILPTLIHIAGAHGMEISGLTLRDGAPEGSGKYGTNMRGFGAVRIERADRVKIEGNVFRNVGVAIHVSESADVSIRGNDIQHTAGNAIYLGTEWGSFVRSYDAAIIGNRIRDVGEVYFETAAIWFQAASHATIAHNLIDGAAQFGIAGGSLWGEADACFRNVIANNTVRNTNRQTADGGAIKMMGQQGTPQATLIRDNVVIGTDQLMNRPDGSFWPPRYEQTTEWPSPISWAIYLDGKASGIEVLDNVLIDNVAAIGINGGWSNRVAGNVISGGAGSAFRVDDATGRGWRPEWASANRFEDNVVSIERADGRVIDVNVPDHGRAFVEFANNTYFGKAAPENVRFQPVVMRTGDFGSLADFAAAGLDVGSTLVGLDSAQGILER